MSRFVIFDVDGTLIDSVDQHTEAWQKAFRHFGKEIAFEDLRSQIGKGADQLLPVFWTREELARIEKPLSAFRAQLFKSDYLPQLRPFPQVRPLFQRLLEQGSKIALASSAKGDELQNYKRLAQIDDLLEAETSSDDAAESKPHPDIFQAALKKLGSPAAEEVLVVGDTPYDIEAAAKAHLRTVAVRCGGFPEDSLRGAIALYQDPADLLEHFADSPLAIR